LNKNVILITIILMAVVLVGAFVAFTLNTPAAEDASLTVNGSKVSIVNNNTDVWVNWYMEVEDATYKNGTPQKFYMNAFIKPGENVTFDLSDMLEYGNETLPTDTNLTVLAWGALLSDTTGNTGQLTATFFGWTENQIIPDPTTFWRNAINPRVIDENQQQPIGQLPSGITGSTILIGTTPGDVDTYQIDNIQQTFVQLDVIIDDEGIPHFKFMNMIIDDEGVPQINYRVQPVVCEYMAQV